MAQIFKILVQQKDVHSVVVHIRNNFIQIFFIVICYYHFMF